MKPALYTYMIALSTLLTFALGLIAGFAVADHPPKAKTMGFPTLYQTKYGFTSKQAAAALLNERLPGIDVNGLHIRLTWHGETISGREQSSGVPLDFVWDSAADDSRTNISLSVFFREK